MISVIVPTLNDGATLPACLSALIPGVVDGLVREVVLADGGSTDATLSIADASGATIISGGATRAERLISGAERARFAWLLFLPPDGVLGATWMRDAETIVTRSDAVTAPAAAVFTHEIDDRGLAVSSAEALTASAHAMLGVSSGARGLLISRQHYQAAGGFSRLAGHETVDLTWRIGRANLVRLRTPLVTSAARYRAAGYAATLAGDGTAFVRFAITHARGLRPTAGPTPSLGTAGS